MARAITSPSEGTIGRLEAEGRVLFRYTDAEGKRDPKWNVNGATNAIAGVLNEKLNVLGLMPHPENHVENRGRLHRRARPVRRAGGAFRAGGMNRVRAMFCDPERADKSPPSWSPSTASSPRNTSAFCS